MTITLTRFECFQLLALFVVALIIAPMRKATQRSQAEAQANRKRFRALLARELRAIREARAQR